MRATGQASIASGRSPTMARAVAAERDRGEVAVGEQDHVVNAKLGEDLGADAIVAQLRAIRRRRCPARTLSACDSASGIGRLITTITPAPSSAIAFIAPSSNPRRAGLGEGVGEDRERVHPDQGRLGRIDMALDQSKLLEPRGLVEESLGGPAAAPAALELRFRGLGDDPVLAKAIGDEVANRADAKAVQLGEGEEIVHPRHAAVLRHDFADHARRIEAGQPGDVDRRLGMAGANQHAAITRDQREDVPRRDDRLGPLPGVDCDRDGARPVGGGNTGG